MENLSSKINSISCGTPEYDPDYHVREICYIINEEEEHPIKITVVLPKSRRPEISNEIISSDSEFVNGFKVVKTANEEYAYIRESDGVLLPYRYDIASDFNQYGFAMVAKDGNATWINQSFQYLSRDEEMVDEDIEDEYYYLREFPGFQKVRKFSTGNYPLGRVYDARNTPNASYYFSAEGKIKEFYCFDGSFNDYGPQRSFPNIDFGDKDYIICSDGILFAKGYHCPSRYVLEFCQQNGIVDAIYEIVDKYFAEEKGQARILKPNNSQK